MVRFSRSRVSSMAMASVATLAMTGGALAQATPQMIPPPAIQTLAQAPPEVAVAPSAASPPLAAAIEVPRIDGIVGAPTKDLLPPAQAASMASETGAEPPKPANAPGATPAAPASSANVVPPVVGEQTVPTKTVDSPKVVEPAFALAGELSERIGRDKSGAVARDDRDAALKFYEARKGEPVWVREAGGFTRSARALIKELGKAGDYGLPLDGFSVSEDLGSGSSRVDLANAEASLTLAALKYARYARGGRMDPTALSRAIDRKAQLLPPQKVLEQLAESNAPDVTLRKFHPQNPQFEKLRLKYVAVKAGLVVTDTPAPVAANVEASKSKKKTAGTPVNKSLSPGGARA